MRHEGPGIPFGAAPKTRAATSSRSPTYSRTTFVGSPERITIDGFDSGFVHDLADSAAHHAFDA
jgi:hypothetical protein